MKVRPFPGSPTATGSEEAFDLFARAFEPRLWRALVPVAGPELAGVATTEALVYAWEHWDRLAGMENPEGYLFRVAQRIAARTDKRSQPAVLPSVEPAELPTVEPALVPALMSLTEMQRTVVWLIDGCGETLVTTATLLDVSVSTVRNHRQRGMKKLRAALKVNTDE